MQLQQAMGLAAEAAKRPLHHKHHIYLLVKLIVQDVLKQISLIKFIRKLTNGGGVV